MVRWMLQCLFCSQDFAHSEAVFPRMVDDPIRLPLTPFFPPEGSVLECPHCHQSGTYDRRMLGFAKV